MPCYNPLRAYKTSAGAIVFAERRQHDITHQLALPCGQCIGCRLERSRQWAMRCMHEASLHENNCFVTLTYDDAFLPHRGQLQYTDFQKFMKRLRKHANPTGRFTRNVRFYMCGEYGPTTWRPHFHACLFNWDFPDKQRHSRNQNGDTLFTSPTLGQLWPFGFTQLGSVTFESAAYVARYCVQKITGHNAKLHYARRDHQGEYQLRPEFNKMSLKPGIGAGWLNKWQNDVYPHDYVVIRGRESKPAKYYDRLYAKQNPVEWEQIQYEREMEGRSRHSDNTEERLKAKEQVAKAKAKLLIRNEIA